MNKKELQRLRRIEQQLQEGGGSIYSKESWRLRISKVPRRELEPEPQAVFELAQRARLTYEQLKKSSKKP